MDGLNPEIMEMMDELQGYMVSQDNNGKPGADQYGMPFEPDDSFSLAPLGFLETAMRMEVQMMELFRMAYKLNRHSPQYIRISGQLEKTVAQMGRYCITKAVLEQQGCSFGYLEDLTIGRLRKITGFNYRKTWSAFMEDCARNDCNGNLPDLSIRWAALDARLKATQEKIDKISSGEIKAEPKVKNENCYPREKTDNAEKDPAPFSPKGCAFPADRAAIREFEQKTAADRGDNTVSTIPDISDPAAAEVTEILPELPETADDTAERSFDFSEEGVEEEDSVDIGEWDALFVPGGLIRRIAVCAPT